MMFLRFFFILSYFVLSYCERTIISLGGLLPLTNSSDCAPAWARWYIATEAVTAVTSSSWWPKQHLSLALEFIGSSESSPVDSILHEATFAGITSGQVPKCQLVSREVCSVARVGMFSLGSSASIQGIDVAYTAPISLVTAGARSNSLTSKSISSYRRAPVFRLGANAEDVGGALWEFLHAMGWQVADLLYMSTDIDSVDIAAGLIARSASENSEHVISGDTLRIHRSWSLKTLHDISDALEEVLQSEPRIVILIAPAPDAAVILSKAQSKGMWGKGWSWIGNEWVSDLATNGGLATKISVEKLPRLAGLVGVSSSPPSLLPASSSSLAQRFSRIRTADIANASHRVDLKAVLTHFGSPIGIGGVYPLLTPTFYSAICSFAFTHPFSNVGFPLDAITYDIFDAIWNIASASAYCSPNASIILTKECVIEKLGVNPRQSPLSGRSSTFSVSGEENGARLALFNPRADGSLVIVGSWHRKSQGSHGSGEWELTDKVQWPSGASIIPTDRVGKVEKVLSIAFFIVLVGLILSALTATFVHRSGFTETLPESLITIFVGLAIGAIVRVSSDKEVQASASFSNEIFMLGLLPIIIAESGYSLDRVIFFKNFWSILVFAVFGTLISALTIGFFIFEAGKAGAVISLSFDECMAFASLLSATDPVATLAVFGALRVDPTLNALVYGESVLNDAVGLVLFRVWTAFIVDEVSGLSIFLASIRFVEILLVSILLGYVVGFVCTIVFRIMFKQTAHVAVKEDIKETQHSVAKEIINANEMVSKRMTELREEGKEVDNQGECYKRGEDVQGNKEPGLHSGNVNLRETLPRVVDSIASGMESLPSGIDSISSSVKGSTGSLQEISHDKEDIKKGKKNNLKMMVEESSNKTVMREEMMLERRFGVGEEIPSHSQGLGKDDVFFHRQGGGLSDSIPLDVAQSPTASSTLPEDLGLASPPAKGRGVITFFVSGAVKMIRLGGEASYSHGVNNKAYEGIDESVLVLLFLYISFALTEALNYSGIVAALFCGIALSYYTRKIMSRAGKRMSTAFLRLLASLADTIVFLQVGMTVSLSVSLNSPSVGVLFIITLLGCLIGRALNIAPLSALVNLCRKQKIGLPVQAQMWWAGLRGAIAFSSASSFPSQHRATLLDVTSWICLVTICVMGPTTPSLLG
jgi:NhaP-type Na+/H+ or K+/H+ antiporter